MIYFLIGVAIFIADLLTKLLAKTHLQEIGTIPLIENVFHLTYVENRGAAFGMLEGQRAFFVLVALVFVVAVAFFVVKYRNKTPLINTGVSFMTAGALGNAFDRICQGFVVDFFDFTLIDFPVFNVADVFVCVGAGLLAIFFIFFDEGNSKEKGESDERDS